MSSIALQLPEAFLLNVCTLSSTLWPFSQTVGEANVLLQLLISYYFPNRPNFHIEMVHMACQNLRPYFVLCLAGSTIVQCFHQALLPPSSLIFFLSLQRKTSCVSFVSMIICNIKAGLDFHTQLLVIFSVIKPQNTGLLSEPLQAGHQSVRIRH